MENIENLFDGKYVERLFAKRLMPLYPDFRKVKKIEIRPYKKHIWKNSYHIVVEYDTVFTTRDGKIRRMPIVCTAHSSEPRRNVYIALRYLWDQSFSKGNLTVPHPLFYSQRFRGTFYRGVKGENLYHFIREGDRNEIERIVPLAARWFAKLHTRPTAGARNFNKMNSRITTVIPGVKHILERIGQDYPAFLPAYRGIYDIILAQEKRFFATTKKRWLIHGDAHPENVIKMNDKKIAIIDFTDLCLADFARDLGSFLQQLEFMMERKIGDRPYVERTKKVFLEAYFERAGIKPDAALEERIYNYYYWTALRTATFFLLKSEPEPDRAHGLLVKLCYGLGVDCHV